MFRKVFTLVLVMLIFTAVSAFGQAQGIVQCEPTGGYYITDSFAGTDDSADAYNIFIFDIPTGGRTDTLHLLIWGDATTYDAMDLNINSFFGFKKSVARGRTKASYAWSPESTAVADDFNTELYAYSYLLVTTADDTLMNGVAGQKGMFDAIKISVTSGGTGNGSDVDYALKIVTSVDHTK